MRQIYSGFVLLLLICLIFSHRDSYSQSWNALGTGVNGTVNAVIVFNGQLIVAGSFSSPASNIARWNGTAWSPLAGGLNGPVYALTIYNNQLIAGGSFNNAGNNIASWNGTSWTALGLGTNDTVFALTVYASSLRAGGAFTTAGGVNCRRLALYNGSWGSMPNSATNGADNTVYSLAVFWL